MSKSVYTPEFKLMAVEQYLTREKSCKDIAKEYGISEWSLRAWIKKYKEHGLTVFIKNKGNANYTKEFKQMCVEAVLNGEGSVDDIVAKYNISDRRVLRRWIKKYNAHIELKDYTPNREVYMSESRRKTTIEERKEIVEYCITHNCNYRDTANF